VGCPYAAAKRKKINRIGLFPRKKNNDISLIVTQVKIQIITLRNDVTPLNGVI